jgi:hypothetical protein
MYYIELRKSLLHCEALPLLCHVFPSSAMRSGDLRLLNKGVQEIFIQFIFIDFLSMECYNRLTKNRPAKVGSGFLGSWVANTQRQFLQELE